MLRLTAVATALLFSASLSPMARADSQRATLTVSKERQLLLLSRSRARENRLLRAPFSRPLPISSFRPARRRLAAPPL